MPVSSGRSKGSGAREGNPVARAMTAEECDMRTSERREDACLRFLGSTARDLGSQRLYGRLLPRTPRPHALKICYGSVVRIAQRSPRRHRGSKNEWYDTLYSSIHPLSTRASLALSAGGGRDKRTHLSPGLVRKLDVLHHVVLGHRRTSTLDRPHKVGVSAEQAN